MTDTNENKPSLQEAENSVKKNKRTLYILLIVSIAPIAFAYFSFFTGIGVPSSTASYGSIINPALNTAVLFDGENATFYAELMKNKKWHLFIPVAESCDQQCVQNLYLTRQVHIRLGEKSTRVERVLIHLGDIPLEQRMSTLHTEHPLLKGVRVAKSMWLDTFRTAVDEANPDIKPYYLLVDQEGFAMMYYDDKVKGGDLLKDLKRALKHSIDYQ